MITEEGLTLEDLPNEEHITVKGHKVVHETLDSVTPNISTQFPYFIVSISAFQCFVFHLQHNNGLVQLLVFNPYRRFEIWRFVTAMFIHGNKVHLWGNLVSQFILGFPLEMKHHSKRVATVYFAGELFSSLAASVWKPWTYLIGASGGVFSLLFSHLSVIFLNWREMKYVVLRVSFIVACIVWQVWVPVSRELIGGQKSNTSHATHLGGALAGLLVGLSSLKNFKEREWELELRAVCKYLTVGFVVATATANIYLQVHFFVLGLEISNSALNQTNVNSTVDGF